jgi:hypothetical protein
LALLFLLISCSDTQTNDYDLTDINWYNFKSEFIINTDEELARIAKFVNNGNDFSGKTVKLVADIMLNDTTNWQNWANNPPANEWIPIGANDANLIYSKNCLFS